MKIGIQWIKWRKRERIDEKQHITECVMIHRINRLSSDSSVNVSTIQSNQHTDVNATSSLELT